MVSQADRVQKNWGAAACSSLKRAQKRAEGHSALMPGLTCRLSVESTLNDTVTRGVLHGGTHSCPRLYLLELPSGRSQAGSITLYTLCLMDFTQIGAPH